MVFYKRLLPTRAHKINYIEKYVFGSNNIYHGYLLNQWCCIINVYSHPKMWKLEQINKAQDGQSFSKIHRIAHHFISLYFLPFSSQSLRQHCAKKPKQGLIICLPIPLPIPLKKIYCLHRNNKNKCYAKMRRKK